MNMIYYECKQLDDEPKGTCSLCRMADIDVIIQNSCEDARKYFWIKPIITSRKKLYTH